MAPELNNNVCKPPAAPRRRSVSESSSASSDRESRRQVHLRIPLKDSWFVYVAPTALAVLCYLNGLTGDFVHDDVFAIKNNADVTGKSPWSSLLKTDFWGKAMISNTSHKSYRPACVATFRLNYLLGGGSPVSFHVVNVILHAIVTSSMTLLFRRGLRLPSDVTMFAGLLFAVHPVHVEAVTGIVGRAELLASLLTLVAIAAYIRSVEAGQGWGEGGQSGAEWPWLGVTLLTALTAMLCKEHGIMSLPVCAALDVILFSSHVTSRIIRGDFSEPGTSSLFKRLFVLATVVVAMLALRLWIMDFSPPTFQDQDNPASFAEDFLTRVLSYHYVYAYNTWLLLCPALLCYDWQVGSLALVRCLSDPRNLASLCLLLALLLLALRGLRHLLQGSTSKTSVPAVGLVLLVLPFLPASNLFFRVGFVLAERILYLPSMGFCLLVGQGLSSLLAKVKVKSPQGHKVMLACFLLYLALLGTRTWIQNRTWQSRQALFESGVAALPWNAKVHYNYANLLKDSGQQSLAVLHYRTSLSLYPQHASVHNNLGTLLKNSTESEHHYRQALSIYPDHKGAHVNLGMLLYQRGEKEQGRRLVERALELEPQYVDGLLALGKMLLEEEQWGEAECHLKQALEQSPDSPDAHNFMGVFLQRTGRAEAAMSHYQQAFSRNPRHALALSNAASCLRQLGRNEEAEQLLNRVLAIKPDANAGQQLALMYMRSGRLAQARDMYSSLIRSDPDNVDCIVQYVNLLLTTKTAEDVQEAERLVERAVTSASPRIDLYNAASNVYAVQGKHNQAVAMLDKALQLSYRHPRDAQHTAQLLFNRGNNYRDLGKHDMALQDYKEAVRLDDNTAKYHLNLGGIYHLKEDYTRARRHYERVLALDPSDQHVHRNLDKLSRLEGKARRHGNT